MLSLQTPAVRWSHVCSCPFCDTISLRVLLLFALTLPLSNMVSAQSTCSSPQIITAKATDPVSCTGTGATSLTIAAPASLIKTEGQHAVEIKNYQGLDLQLGKIETSGKDADGIRLAGVSGTTGLTVGDIVIAGGSNQSDESRDGAFGIYFLQRRESLATNTTIQFGNISLTGLDGFNSNEDLVSAVNAETTGSISLSSNGKIETTANLVGGITIKHGFPNIPAATGSKISISVKDILTKGSVAHGINAVYWSALDTTTDTAIDLTVSGTVRTIGDGSIGVLVSYPNAQITLNVGSEGSIVTEGENHDGETGPKEIYAISLVGSSATANRSAKINNFGTVSGNILTEGCAEYQNRGITISRDTIAIAGTECPEDVTPGFFNHGTLDIGGKEKITTTAHTGNFYQRPAGVMLFDINWENPEDGSDRLTIDGQADLDGTVLFQHLELKPYLQTQLTLSDRNWAVGTDIGQPIVFLTSTMNIQDDLPDAGPDPSPFLAHRISLASDKRSLRVGLALGDGLKSLNQNRTSVFWGINESGISSSVLRNTFLDIILSESIQDAQHALDSFGNEIAGATIRTLLSRNAHPLLCAEGDSNPSVDSDRCHFITPLVRASRHDGNLEQLASDENLAGALIGFPIWRSGDRTQLRLIGEIVRTEVELKRLARSTGSAGHFGLQYMAGLNDTLFTLTATLGKGSYDISRYLAIAEGNRISNGKLEAATSAIAGKIHHPLSLGNGTLHLTLNLSFVQVKTKSYSETGANDHSLNVQQAALDYFETSSQLEFKANDRLAVLGAYPFVGLGYTRRSDNQIKLVSEFQQGDGQFTTIVRMPESELTYFVGIRFFNFSKKVTGKIGVSGYYSGSEDLRGSALDGELSIRF